MSGESLSVGFGETGMMQSSCRNAVEVIRLHKPELEEVAKVLEKSLEKSFVETSVSIVDCPDLTCEPFHLLSPGLCGSPRLTDIGGIPYLNPVPVMDKIYDLKNVPKWSDLSDSTSVFMIGAGAGPSHVLSGTLAEMMSNIHIDSHQQIKNKSRICKIKENGFYLLENLENSSECMHMMNLFISEGKPGKVIELKAKCRIGNEAFIHSLQSALRNHYGTQPVGLGGTFVLSKGKARVHVMPCYSETPLQTDVEIQNWLKFFEMSSPLTCLGYLMSYDPGFSLRMEHFHCFSNHGDGGHFHYDTTPQEAEYIGYFNVPEYLFRVDRPAL